MRAGGNGTGFPRAGDVEGVVDFLSRFIQHSSEAPKDGPAHVSECMHWLRDEVAGWGLGKQVDLWEGSPGEPNLAVRLPGKSGASAVMFNGHADVVAVPSDELPKWRYPPYGGEVHNGRVWGRGASDMKGGVAAFLWAAKLVHDAGVELSDDALFTANVGEESARPRVGIQSVLRRGYHAPLVINAEPSSLRLCVAGCGWFFFTVEVTGRSTHPANRHLYLDDSLPVDEKPGIDAVEKLLGIMNGLTELETEWQSGHDELFPARSTNMTCVSVQGGGRAAAMVSLCHATYAVIYDSRYRADAIIARIQGVLDDAAHRDPWLAAHPPKLTVPDVDEVIYEVFRADPRSDVAQSLVSAVEHALGKRCVVGVFSCPSDANLTSAAGYETFVIGPGDLSYGCHGINEYVPVEDLKNAVRVYAEIIMIRCRRKT